MKQYEMIREIFNNCSGNEMRDVDIQTIDTDNIEDYVRLYIEDPKATVERIEAGGGTIIYNIEIAGQRQRFSFTEL